jgi:hypothetical protein
VLTPDGNVIAAVFAVNCSFAPVVFVDSSLSLCAVVFAALHAVLTSCFNVLRNLPHYSDVVPTATGPSLPLRWQVSYLIVLLVATCISAVVLHMSAHRYCEQSYLP